MYQSLLQFIEHLDVNTITQARKSELNLLVNYINKTIENNSTVKLNFICTHNSRRSQFSQIWAQVLAWYFKIPAETYSGGVEVTAFNETAVQTLVNQGFKIEKRGSENPHYIVKCGDDFIEIEAFSKLVEAENNPKTEFAAIMTCSHADENCPFIAGADVRIPIRYEDPKEADGTPEEQYIYAERSKTIATEMKYVFKSVKAL